MKLTLAASAALAVVLALSPVAEAQTRSGAFSGAGGHATSGSASVSTNGGGATLTLGSNFRFDGAPDPRLAFGTARGVDRGTMFARLAKNSGAQRYGVPRNIDTAAYTHVWLWCRRFDTPLGRARLSN